MLVCIDRQVNAGVCIFGGIANGYLTACVVAGVIVVSVVVTCCSGFCILLTVYTLDRCIAVSVICACYVIIRCCYGVATGAFIIGRAVVVRGRGVSRLGAFVDLTAGTSHIVMCVVIIRYGVRVLVRRKHLNNISANGTFTVAALIVRLLGACYLTIYVLTHLPMSVCIGFPIAVEIVLLRRFHKPAALGAGDGRCTVAVIGVCDMLESCRSGYCTADRA